MNTTPSGLQFTDSVVGDGDEAASGQFVTVHYTGWLYEDGDQLDIKLQSGVRWNDATRTARTVTEFGRNDERALSANLHT